VPCTSGAGSTIETWSDLRENDGLSGTALAYRGAMLRQSNSRPRKRGIRHSEKWMLYGLRFPLPFEYDDLRKDISVSLP
jgi:hypothetical protein